MTEPWAEGFAAALLARAEGRKGPLRPRIAPYFGPQTTPEPPPVEEVSLERPSAPPESAESPVRAESPRPAPEAGADPPHEPQPVIPVPETRLMPPAPAIPPDPAPSPREGRPAVVPEARPAERPGSPERPAPTLFRRTAGAADPAAAKAAPAPEAPEQGPEPSPSLPDFGPALAQAIARLAPGAPRDAPETLMPRPEPLRPVAPPEARNAAAAPEARQDGGEAQAAAPLHIHIGEIVIAPDPQSPPAQGPAAPKRPHWQPVLSLDAYRDSRRRQEP